MTLKILSMGSALLTFAFAMHGLITDSNMFLGWMMLSFAMMILLMGIEEIQKDKKWIGYISFGASILISISAFQEILRL
ncbi:DUF3953 domain-containing protein [Jeotgalibacillus terrae]|uniref:DUF3953 domain-containing protein n=1 Tax=Jeotgalibacillus terrae TaxID=587735 RepID=A0ABW5ZHB0_9BACL|nr:DUF3953 domain-containing protein [Jeotgalibacillus terrae]MBM7578756.1 hypothetical protein [Jeotgalibacillus terrae]